MPGKKVLVVSGKRKTATAKAVVKQGLGRVRVNDNDLFTIQEPFGDFATHSTQYETFAVYNGNC